MSDPQIAVTILAVAQGFTIIVVAHLFKKTRTRPITYVVKNADITRVTVSRNHKDVTTGTLEFETRRPTWPWVTHKEVGMQ